MKKIFCILIITLAFAACQKQNADSGSDIDTSGYTVFSANTEEVEMLGSRSFKLWEDGDCIGLFGSTSGVNQKFFLKRSGVGKSDAVFYGPVVKGDAIFAYYPYSETAELENGKYPFMLSSVQDLNVESAADAFFACDSLSVASMNQAGKLDFKYPMGVLSVEFHFDEIINVKEISLTGKNPICGKMLVDASCNVTPSEVATKVISLDLDGQIVPSKVGEVYTPFYFVLPPAVYAFKNLTLNVKTDKEDMTITLKETTVPRVKACDFKVASVEITSSDLPGFNKEDGYLE